MGVEVLAATALIATAASTYTGYTAQRNQAKAAKAMGEYNNRLAEMNARNAENEANETAHRQRIEKRRALADINAQTAASGAVMEGSPLAVLGETGRRMEIDIADTTRRAQIEAQQLRNEGQIALWKGQQEAKGHRLAATGTLFKGLSSIGNIGVNHAQMEKNGLTNSNVFGLKPK